MAATAQVQTSSTHVRLTTRTLAIDVDLASGAVAVSSGRWRPLIAGYACAELSDGEEFSSAGAGWEVLGKPRAVRDAHGQGRTVTLATPSRRGLRLLLELAVYDIHPFALARAGLENAGDVAVSVQSLTPLAGSLDLQSPVAGWRIYRHGWQSWTPTLSLSAAQQDIDAQPPVHAPAPSPARRGSFASDDVAAIYDPDAGRSLLLGFISARRDWPQILVDAGRRHVRALSHADGRRVAPGETLFSERASIDVDADANAALERYADALAREMDARVPPATPSGWCSWYYYYTDVTEADVLHNLRRLQERRDELPLDYVQIDDGYQADIGDWATANDKFPRGMAPLAADIHAAGFKAGIWLAPFLVGERSRLYADHPAWVVRDEVGQPLVASRNWNQTVYALDCTHPEAERWLYETFREVTHDWGYDYVKIDFLYGAAVTGIRHDRGASRIEAYRRGLGTIRRAVGERFVLGCGALMAASVGLVDGQRIGPDVAPWWRWGRPTTPPRRAGSPRAGGEPSAENAIRNVLTRSWMHGRLWANDPDCLLVRQERSKLTRFEGQSLATAIALSGGMVLSSDDLTQLSQQRLDIVSSLLPPLAPLASSAAVPIDLMTQSMPAEFALDVRRGFEEWRLTGCLNWSGRRATHTLSLPPGRWHVFEFWERRYLGAHGGEIKLAAIPSHGVRLLALRRERRVPQLLATSFHFSMGGREVDSAAWHSRRRTLTLHLRPVAKKRGEAYVHVPPSYRFLRAEGGDVQPKRERGSRVIVLSLELRKPVTLVLHFVRTKRPAGKGKTDR